MNKAIFDFIEKNPNSFLKDCQGKKSAMGFLLYKTKNLKNIVNGPVSFRVFLEHFFKDCHWPYWS